MIGVDKMLLAEMERDDTVETLTEDFDVLDMMYDEETGQAFNNLFASGSEEEELNNEDDNDLHY